MGRVAIPHDRCRLLGYRPTCDFRFSYTWPKYFTSYRRSLYLEWPEVLHEVPTGTNLHSEVIGDAWPHCWKSCDLVWWSVITEESRLVARRVGWLRGQSVITEDGMLIPSLEVYLIPISSKGYDRTLSIPTWVAGHDLINFLMIGQPINIFPCRGGAVVKFLIFTPLLIKNIGQASFLYSLLWRPINSTTECLNGSSCCDRMFKWGRESRWFLRRPLFEDRPRSD